MPYNVYFDQDCQCIMVVVTEQLDLSLLQKIAKDVAELIQETGVRRVLNDMRNAKSTQKTFDIYNMPQTAQNAGVGQFTKRAIVVGDKNEDFYFLETVFINQGHQVRMFTEIEAAKKWLFDE